MSPNDEVTASSRRAAGFDAGEGGKEARRGSRVEGASRMTKKAMVFYGCAYSASIRPATGWSRLRSHCLACVRPGRETAVFAYVSRR